METDGTAGPDWAPEDGKECEQEAKVHKGLEMIKPLRNAIDTGIKAAPEAALAWAGLSCALEILSSPLTEPGKNRDGIAYVVARMDWYWHLSTLLLGENRIRTSNLPLRAQLEKHIVSLYQKLLLYEMKSICLYHRSSLAVVFRDLPKLDDWEAQLKEIKDAEAAVSSDSSNYNTEEIKAQLQNMAVSAVSQETSLKEILSVAQQQTAWQQWARQDDKDKECLRELHDTDPRLDKKRIEDTKGGLIWDSYRWILDNAEYQQWAQDQASRLLWIKGDPGKGKTMLLCGIINEIEKSPTDPVSYFFCQATIDRLRSATAVVRGLIYSLACQRPALISHVRDRYDSAGKGLFSNQNAWQALCEILTEILQSPGSEGCILIVDALDECTAERDQLIDLICKLSSSSKAKWIVSSRNWPEIEEQLNGAMNKSRLHLEMNHAAISNAVQHYITNKVEQLAKNKAHDPETCKSVEQYLVSNAHDTFLWVALVCQALGKPQVHRRQTLRVLETYPAGLDGLYQRMMEVIVGSLDAELCNAILAVVAVAFEPLALAELAASHDTLHEFVTDLSTFEEIVNSCGSFLTIREGVVYMVHQSAKDYLLEKAADKIMASGLAQQHDMVFQSSLAMMSRFLQRDLYGLDDPGVLIDEIQAPSPDPLSCIRYACVHWVDHLCKSGFLGTEEHDTELATLVTKFIQDKYLYWLEAMSLLRRVSEAIKAVRRLENVSQRTGPPESANLMQDALRFILSHRPIMDAAPLQLYHSALLLSPSRSLIRRLFWKEAPQSIDILPSTFQDWDACLQTIGGISPVDGLGSLMFSPDGRSLATVSKGGDNILILDTLTGDCLKSLEGHQAWVNSLSFHPDGKHLASGSIDKTILIWDTSTGKCIKALRGHLSSVARVVFSPDGHQLVSISSEEEMKVWDPWTGNCLISLSIESIIEWIEWAFSSLGKPCLLSIAETPESIDVWDPTTGEQISAIPTPEGIADSDLQSAALAPDGERLALMAGGMIWICNWRESSTLHTINYFAGADAHMPDLAWAPDAELLAVGTINDIIIWDLQEDIPLTRLTGHMSYVESIFFGKGHQLASMSIDGSLKLWSVVRNSNQPIFDKVNEPIRGLLLGPDEQLVEYTMGSDMHILDTATGSTIHKLPYDESCCNALIGNIVFGPRCLASLTCDGHLTIWDTATGECLHALRPFDSFVDYNPALAFGPVGQLACVSDKVTIWDVATGICLKAFGEAKGGCAAVAFSEDGRLAYSTKADILIWKTQTGALERRLEVENEGDFDALDISSSNLLAGAKWQRGIYIWDLNYGTFIQRVSIYYRLAYLHFDPASSFRLNTRRGVLTLDLPKRQHELTDPVDPVWYERSIRISFEREAGWVMKGSKRLFWIPIRTRDGDLPQVVADTTTKGSVVALVLHSKTLILRFKER